MRRVVRHAGVAVAALGVVAASAACGSGTSGPGASGTTGGAAAASGGSESDVTLKMWVMGDSSTNAAKLLADFTKATGIKEWLTDPTTAKVSVVVVAIWRATGLNIIVLLAAQQDIPAEYYEAASIDGAGRWRQILTVTVPLLRFALSFVTVTTLIGWMQFFDEPFVLTRGGPLGATTSVSIYIYQQGFKDNEFGFASAASLVLFLLIFAVTALQLRFRKAADV